MYLNFLGFIPVSGDFWAFAERMREIENCVCIALVNDIFHLFMYKDKVFFNSLNVRKWKKKCKFDWVPTNLFLK